MPETTTPQTVTQETASKMLDRARKLLAKAESTDSPQEAEALTEGAADLMAKYGIDRAMLADAQPQTDWPDDRWIEISNPWARVLAYLLDALARAMRCEAVQFRSRDGVCVHLGGYRSDIERADILFTSLVLQMAKALGAADVPATRVAAWRRSFLLGYCYAVVQRVQAAEASATPSQPASASRVALVLADRSQVALSWRERTYPAVRKLKTTYSGSGFGAGRTEGERANIGGTSVSAGRTPQVTA